jgi:hypothetical protein
LEGKTFPWHYTGSSLPSLPQGEIETKTYSPLGRGMAFRKEHATRAELSWGNTFPNQTHRFRCMLYVI